MAIKQVTMFAAFCNECGTKFEDADGLSAARSEDEIAEWASLSGWHITAAKCRQRCFCPSCSPASDE